MATNNTKETLASAWNETFEYKISVANLKKPTQAFVLDALQCFLETIHIDYNKLKAKMDDRLYKIFLVKYFNHSFQTKKFKCKMLYGDIIQPESRKTCSMLSFLQNYCMFFKMVKEEVVGISNDKIEVYNTLLSKKSQLQLQQEEQRILFEKKEVSLKEYTRLITENKQLLEQLKAESASLTQNICSTTQQINVFRDENIKEVFVITELGPLVVSQDELDKLAKSLEEIDDDIVKLDSAEETFKNNNECYLQEIKQINGQIEEFDKIIPESSILDAIEKFKEGTKNLSEMNKKIQEFRSQIENAVTTKAELLQHSKTMEIRLLKKKTDLVALSEDIQEKKLEMESEYKRNVQQNIALEKKLEMTGQQTEDLKLSQEHIIARGIEVIEYIERT